MKLNQQANSLKTFRSLITQAELTFAHYEHKVSAEVDESHTHKPYIQCINSNQINTLLKPFIDLKPELEFGDLLSELELEFQLQADVNCLEVKKHDFTQTRLALWERLWLLLGWEFGEDQLDHLDLTAKILKKSLIHLKAIGLIMAELKGDPKWTPSEFKALKKEFFVEASLVHVLNHTRDDLKVSLASLDADLLDGLDLSIRRAKPNKASAWVQVSLSAEEELNQQKLKKLTYTPATILISPWTLTEFIFNQSKEQQISYCVGLGLDERSVNKLIFARHLSQVMRTVFGRTQAQLISIMKEKPKLVDHLSQLFSAYIDQNLGIKPKRPYRQRTYKAAFQHTRNILQERLKFSLLNSSDPTVTHSD